MIGSTRAIRVFAWPEPIDLRNGFDGLAARVRAALGAEPLMRGDYFLFVNRSRASCKVLHWDGTGLCIYQKRLSRGRFPALWREQRIGTETIALTSTELALFLEGCKEVGYRALSPAPLQ